ncbi:unnamed protein product, partial [Staurois parvus]
MSNDTLITGKCNCRFSAALSSRWIGTDDQCPDDRCPAVPPTSSAHLCPAVRPPVPRSATHLCPAVPPTCAQQCHPPVR